jgi:ABC-type bacteriocin/lantibiotic exporter with double-glycine peptidase domain
MNWLNVTHQPQHKSSWCLPACVAMVSTYWGIPVRQVDVARWLGTSDIGTPSSRTQRLTNQKYSVIYGEGSLAILSGWLEQDAPLILFVRTGDLPYWKIDTAHALIVAGLDTEQATLIDPAVDAAYCVVPLGDLLLAWSHFDYTFAVVRPIA